MNWGHKITLIFLAFASMMIYMVITSFRANVDLVTEDYYLQELNFQQQIDKTNNVKRHQKQVTHRLTQQGLILQYSENTIPSALAGSVTLYRPSRATMDRMIPVAVDQRLQQTIAPEYLMPGKYILKIDWEEDQIPYYQEIEMIVPGA